MDCPISDHKRAIIKEEFLRHRGKIVFDGFRGGRFESKELPYFFYHVDKDGWLREIEYNDGKNIIHCNP